MVDAEMYKTITGRLSGVILTHSGTLTVSMGKPCYGSVSMLSLDGLPLDGSKKILVSAVARVRNSGMHWDKEKHSVIKWGKGPVLCERICGEAILRRSSQGEMQVFPLDGAGRKEKAIPARVHESKLYTPLGAADTVWYIAENAD